MLDTNKNKNGANTMGACKSTDKEKENITMQDARPYPYATLQTITTGMVTGEMINMRKEQTPELQHRLSKST